MRRPAALAGWLLPRGMEPHIPPVGVPNARIRFRQPKPGLRFPQGRTDLSGSLLRSLSPYPTLRAKRLSYALHRRLPEKETLLAVTSTTMASCLRLSTGAISGVA